MSAERIAVTGVGVISPIGIGQSDFSAALRSGRSGGGKLTAFDSSGFETRIAAQVDASFDPSVHVEPRKMIKHMTRAAAFAVSAAAMARTSARLGRDDVDPFRLGVSLGAGGMGPVDVDMLEHQGRAAIISARESGTDYIDLPSFARAFTAITNPISMLRGLPNLAAAHLAIQQNARGPNNTITTGCSAGTQAIGEGMRQLQRGEVDVMLTGGADAMINPIGVLGFTMLGTLSRCNEDPARASKPFDARRDGFVIGEGAAILVLERESFARARGAPILAELAGYGCTCDAFRVTDERPDASSAVMAMRNALRDADVSVADLEYINAHGTGTQMNDATETRAIKALFNGASVAPPPISSTKSMIGHLLAAAGAVEIAATILAMRDGFLPPTINYEVPDDSCDLDYVPNVARDRAVSVAMSNSFGFGGQNASLVVRQW